MAGGILLELRQERQRQMMQALLCLLLIAVLLYEIAFIVILSGKYTNYSHVRNAIWRCVKLCLGCRLHGLVQLYIHVCRQQIYSTADWAWCLTILHRKCCHAKVKLTLSCAQLLQEETNKCKIEIAHRRSPCPAPSAYLTFMQCLTIWALFVWYEKI